MALVLLAVLVTMGGSTAYAAEDAVCRPYATLFINNLMKWMWTRAYSHCSVLEEDHPIPPPSSGWRAALDILDPAATPIVPIDRTDLAHIGDVPATDKPSATPPVQTLDHAVAGLACKRAHPRGYRGSDNTYIVLQGRTWTHVPCPG